MTSTFGGISMCTAGLYTAQTSLYVANTNISNAAVDGYTKKEVVQHAGYTTTISRGNIVVGVKSEALLVKQLRNQYLDHRYWEENPQYGEWTVKTNALTQLESILTELDDSGLTAKLDDLKSALEALSTEPQNPASRTAVIQEFLAIADSLNNESAKLVDLQSSLKEEVYYQVSKVNALTEGIASLNQEILSLELAGGDANALVDQRNNMVDSLSQLIDIDVVETKAGTGRNGEDIYVYNILSDNNYLVQGDEARELSIEESLTDMGELSLALVINGDETYHSTSGALKGNIDMCTSQGENGAYQGVPFYMKALDEFASTFADVMNDIQLNGFGLDGSPSIPIFTEASPTAHSIKVNEILLEHPEKLAISSHADQEGNTDQLNAFIKALNSKDIFKEATFNDYLSSMSTKLGATLSYAKKQTESSNSLRLHIDNSRQSVSGVSLDEEMSQLVFHQQIYDATAKMMNVWNEIIETTIQQLGG